MATLKAKPTEWYGIRYRSKSEAMLSAYLHQSGLFCEYEPEWLSTDEYTPDFSCVGFNHSDNLELAPCPGRFQPTLTVIEYKPSQPTDTYVDCLHGHFERIADDVYAQGTWPCVLLELWVGSFWDESDRYRLRWMPTSINRPGWWRLGWHGDHADIQRVKEIRFDLK